MSVSLYGYQQDIIDKVRARMKAGVKSILITAPTGSGKTILTAFMLKRAAEKGIPSLFTVHRRELIKQSVRAFGDVGVKHGVIAANFFEDRRHLIQLGSIQTLARRIDNIKKPTLIIYDECIDGESKIFTDVGLIKIKDFEKYLPRKILSFGGRWANAFKDIKGWRKVGVKKCKTITLASGKFIKGTLDHPILTEKGWKTIGEITIGDNVFALAGGNRDACLGHCWETHQSDIQTREVRIRELYGIIPQLKPNGLSISQNYLKDLVLKIEHLKTKDTEKELLAIQRLACRSYEKYIHWLKKMEKSMSRSDGLKALEGLELLGGIATMVAFAPTKTEAKRLDSIQKVMAKLRTKESHITLKNDTGKCPSIKTNHVSSLLFQWMPPKHFSEISHRRFQRVCGISSEEYSDVYDLSVADTECFYANGILVHNCHHLAAGSWSKLYKAFPDAFHIGLTATPERLDGKGLKDYFREIVRGPSVQWLISNGFLSPYKLFAPASVNVSKFHILGGDYKKDELNATMDKPTITGDAIKHYKRLADGKRAVVFCVSIEHSKHVVSQFQAAGIPSAHVDGETPTEERDEAVKKFAEGKIRVLSNVELFGEGFDLPSLEVAILLRPTASLGLYLQQVGRSLRVSSGKETALILDHVGNVSRHGLPDEEREWSLAGHAGHGKKGEKETTVRICGACFAAQKSGNPVCQFCGFVFEKKYRKVEEQDGELAEVDLDKLRKIKRMEQGRCETFQDLVELGKKRKYRRPYLWAKYLWNARQRRKVGFVGV